MQHYLPYTRLYQQDRDILQFLENHREVFLKGVVGGRGKRIFHIRKLSGSGYEYSNYVGRLTVEQVGTSSELLQKVHEFYKGRSFIIQAPIELIKLGDSKVDFRAELQRNGQGELTITGICARIGKSHAPITIHSAAYPIETFFMEYMGYSAEKIQELTGRIHSFLLTIYQALERAYGMFCEIGIDFGIDRSEDIWFIEPNAKSAKVSLMKAYDHEVFHQSFVKPLQFARYIYIRKNKQFSRN